MGNTLTQKDLTKQTGAPPYVIKYLKSCGRLPIVKESPGPGYKIFYSPDAIEVVKRHLKRSKLK